MKQLAVIKIGKFLSDILAKASLSYFRLGFRCLGWVIPNLSQVSYGDVQAELTYNLSPFKTNL